MKLSQFKFKLPEEQIALYPQSLYREFENEDGTKETVRFTRRDECRLMVLHRKSQTIEMYKRDADGNPIEGEYLDFRNVLDYFDEGDTFIFNDTKVFPARLYGTKEKTDAKIEVFLLRELNEEMRLWDVLVEPARKIRIGNKLFFDDSGTMVAEVIDNTTSRGRTLRFLYDCPHDEFKRELFALGEAPLPHYIIDQREVHNADAQDMEDFQCIFAKNEGAVTAPATGLHFSRELMKRMEIKGLNFAYITLHCGLGTFHDIEVEDLTKHKMDSEQMFIGEEACDIVNRTKEEGHHVCAVGTSVVKATETAVGTDGLLKEFEGWTNKFIFPPYDFGLADSMIANFYHPLSTLLMETAAFGGYDLVMKAYDMAGIALAEGHGAGLTIEEFNKTIGAYNDYSSDEIRKVVESGEYVPSYMWNQNGWLCSKLGLHVKSQVQQCIPTTWSSDLESSTLGFTVKAGDVTGMRAVVTTETEEGITLETECVGKVYAPEEFDKNEWTLYGEPESSLVCNKPATVELTCANIINRIPQLIDAKPGYVTTDKFPYNIYCIRPLNEYVTSK